MAKRKAAAGIADEVRPAFDEIAGLVESFCKENLNDEYAVLCRKLTEKLARKRPSTPSPWLAASRTPGRVGSSARLAG